jgi:leucyl aminopeptidase (aminopeptidase T)
MFAKQSNLSTEALKTLSSVAMRVIDTYLAVKPSENFAIVTDTATSPEISEALMQSATALGIDATHLRITPRASSGAEPPAVAEATMVAADVCLCVASRSLYHTNAKGAAQQSGTRGSFNAPHLVDAWVNGAMTADFVKIREVAVRVADRLRGSEHVRVTSPSGTDITVGVGGREPKAWMSGICHHPGEISAYPGGEVSFPPLEGTSNGVIVVETVMTDVGPIKNPITLTIEAGECVRIGGGTEAEYLRRLIDGVPGATNLAELGIGLNPSARVGDLVTEAKKALGTSHFALGDNAGGYGGVVECAMHLDGLNLGVSIWVDDEPLVRAGQLLV